MTIPENNEPTCPNLPFLLSTIFLTPREVWARYNLQAESMVPLRVSYPDSFARWPSLTCSISQTGWNWSRIWGTVILYSTSKFLGLPLVFPSVFSFFLWTTCFVSCYHSQVTVSVDRNAGYKSFMRPFVCTALCGTPRENFLWLCVVTWKTEVLWSANTVSARCAVCASTAIRDVSADVTCTTLRFFFRLLPPALVGVRCSKQ